MPAPLDPTGFFRRLPLLPHQLTTHLTPTADVIVLCHLGVPRLSAQTWRLTIDGLVECEMTLDLAALRRFPKLSVESVHQCAGSPLQPDVPTRRITNVVWGGARLADVLAAADPKPEAAFVWSTGADHGAFDGVACEAYVKDLPVSRIAQDVLVAYELNGAPLPPEHGFPARLVVPGFYGTNSVKWLTHIRLACTRADGPFTTRWYNDVVPDAAGGPTGQTRPVWAIAPEAVIVSPAPDQRLQAGLRASVHGWAWADGGVDKVELSDDGGASWSLAELEPANGRGWQRFARPWTPSSRGTAVLMARATAANGEVQPLEGRRNEVHKVSVSVV